MQKNPSLFHMKRTPARIVHLWLTALTLCGIGLGQAADPAPVQAPVFDQPPKIDGRLDDAAWRKGKWSEEFVLADPSLKKAGVQTRFKVGVDSRYFYFAAAMEQPKDAKLVADAKERDGQVWKDDSIELMLQPIPSMDQYYHFVINSAGVVYDALRVQGGNLADSSVNLSMQVAISTTPQGWTVEMAIPLAELGLTEEAGVGWAVNVARNLRVGSKTETSTYARIHGGLHKPGEFVPMYLEALDVTPFLWEVSAVGDSRVVKDEGKLMLETQVSVTNKTDKYTFFNMDFEVRQGEKKLGNETAPRGLDAGAGRIFQVRIPIGESQGEAMADVALKDAKSGALLARLQYPVRVDYTPLKITLTSPAYRDAIYNTQKLEEIRGKVEINLPSEKLAGSELTVRLENASGKVLSETKIDDPANSGEFTLNLPANLPVGNYRVHSILKSASGSTQEATLPLARLGPPPGRGREVRLGENKVTYVDGKPFLPMGAMEIKPQEDLEIVAAQGYTAILVYSFYWWNENAQKEWLDRLHKLGLMALIYPYPKPEMARNPRLREPLSKEEKEQIRAFVKKWKDHPALLAWYLADEPELHSTQPRRLEELNKICREEDPYHPTIILNNTTGGIDTYSEYCDILMPNPFPGFYQGGGPRRNIDYAYTLVRHAADALGGNRGVWSTPQAFSWADLRTERSNERPPDFTEMRNMCYQAIIAGGKGFIPYSYQHGRRHPSIRLSLAYLAKELDLVKPAALAPESPIEFTATDDSVRYSLRSADGVDTLFVVNVSPAHKEFTATVPQKGKWYVVSEKREVTTDGDGKLSESIPPFGVRIYTTSPEIAGSLDVAEAERIITEAPTLESAETPLPENEKKNAAKLFTGGKP